MKATNLIKSILSLSLFAPLAASAAVPQRWTVETSRLQPVVFDVVRGETLALEASFKSYGTPVSTSNLTAFLCWQTNGMANAWWKTNAVTTGTSASALFTPEMDPGAPVVTAFLGLSQSNQTTQTPQTTYRAAFTLRFRPGPGAVPNALPLPTPTIDCAKVTFIHPESAPFGGGGVTSQQATNIAGRVVSNVVTKVYVEDLGIEAGLTEEQVDDRVRSSSNTNLGAVAAAQAIADNTYLSKKSPSQIGSLEWDENGAYLEISAAKIGSHFTVSPYGVIFENAYGVTIGGIGLPFYINNLINSDSVTNGGAKAYADETFRTRTDNVCHTNLLGDFVPDSLPSGETGLVGQPTFISEFGIWEWAGHKGLYNSENGQSADATTVIFHRISGSFTARRTKASTSGQPFVTIDNVPSTNGFIKAQSATNAAEAVVGEVMEYGLTNLTANTETFQLSSGFIGNLTLDNQHTNINLTLVYPASNAKSADVLLRVVNAAETAIAIGSEYTDVDGTDWTKIKAGTNYVMATRTAYVGDRSKVLVSVKEVK